MLAQLMYRERNYSFYEHLQYTLEIKKMSNIRDFDRISKTECNISPETAELRI